MKQDENQIEKIDKFRLDDELENQDVLYRDYALLLADAQYNFDEAENELGFVGAKIATNIRKNPGDFGLTKTTEAAINEAVLQQEDYREAQRDVLDARLNRDVCKKDVTSLDHRKTSLSKMVELFLADYFSRPSVNRESREAMEEATKKAVRRKGVRRD